MRHSKTLKKVAIRMLQMIPLLLLVVVLVFILLSFAPGDPAVLSLGADASASAIAATRELMGLNHPLYVQLWEFLKGIIFHGDFGRSYQTGRPVIEEIGRTLPITIQLSIIGIVLSSIVGVFVGVVSAVKQYSLLDNVMRVIVLAGVSMPAFWLGLMLLVVFTAWLGLFPPSGWGSWRQMVLPSMTVAVFPLAITTRLTRSSMLEVIRLDYIRTARAKGLSSRMVIFRHALRNAFIPVITIIGLQFGVLLTGAVLAETVFAIPGLGRLTVTAVYARDYPIIRAVVILAAMMVTLINLTVDILYTILDPRIKFE